MNYGESCHDDVCFTPESGPFGVVAKLLLMTQSGHWRVYRENMVAVSWIQSKNVLLVKKPIRIMVEFQDGSFPQKGWQAHPEETATEITEAIITKRLSRLPKYFKCPGR